MSRSNRIVERIDTSLVALTENVSKSSPYFSIEKVARAKPTQYRLIHLPSKSPTQAEPGLVCMIVLKKPDAEKAIKELLALDLDWSGNLYGNPTLYAKCEPILRKYHYREPPEERKKRTPGFSV